jgi:acetylornithine deacetylase/succinyl-diaminopimelate desuccinylase-like protein
MHKKNEYVKIESLLKAAIIYAEAIYRLAVQ